CVVLDEEGLLCVATSTGGLTNKLSGRIGDTPTVGAGFWAEEWVERRARQGRETVQPPIVRLMPDVLRETLGECLPGLGGYRGIGEGDFDDEKTSSGIRAVAISGTGNGDSFLRTAATRTAAAIARYSPHRTLASAVHRIAGPGGELQRSAGDRWGKTGEGEGGIIGIELVDGIGHIVADFNCGGMFRSWVTDDGQERVMVFREEYWTLAVLRLNLEGVLGLDREGMAATKPVLLWWELNLKWTIQKSFFPTFLTLLSFLFTPLIIWNIILYPKFFSPLRDLPEPKENSLFMGQFAAIKNGPTGAPQQKWLNEVPNDGLIRYLNVFNEERLLITGPKALGEVLTTKNYDFVKPSMVRDGLGRLLGVGVLLAEGDEHRTQRKHLMPAFAFRHIKDLYPVFWAKSSEMTKDLTAVIRSEAGENTELAKAPVIEIGTWSSRATLDIIGLAGMGHDFGAIKDPMTELNVTYRKIFSPSRQASMLGLLSLFMPGWVVRNVPVARNQEIPAAAHVIRKICRQLIDEKKRKLTTKDEEAGRDIISVALSSGGFTEENLVDQMMTFLAAGHETTATAMIWAVHCLCQSPHYQTRLREEIRANLPSIEDPSTPITAETLDRLPFLHAVCNEVLRLQSPVTLTLRQARKNTSICGHHVPKGTKIILCPGAVNKSKELWGADAEEFNPERWLGPGRANTGGASSNYAFLTFLHGPRSCIGQAFAKAEFAVLVAGLAGRFEMELEDKEREMKIQTGITARPKDGMRVRMRVVEGCNMNTVGAEIAMLTDSPDPSSCKPELPWLDPAMAVANSAPKSGFRIAS
ncbi:MAG: hypothetical protein Q9170_004935, partial [Blastenia crenularia]